MDLILKKAQNFTDNHFRGSVGDYKDVLEEAYSEINSFDNPLDKIKFLNFLLERNNKDYEHHLPKCTDPQNCRQNFNYENIAYYLQQKLATLGVNFDSDAFKSEEKVKSDEKIDQILKDLQELKAGQQVIYEDLSREILELKSLHFLGKKKWYQLLLGKSVDMVAGGIISETVSKQIIEIAKENVSRIIGPYT